MVSRKPWTRDELSIVLNLYHKLRFGQLHARQPAVIDLAVRLGRGANSVAMKLGNFASLDPMVRLKGRKGLSGASALDRQVWRNFQENINEAAPAAETAFRTMFGADEDSEVEVLPQGVRVRRRARTGPTETTVTSKQRRGQEFFREVVLNNFGGRCGVTQIAIRELLVASHILPWSSYEAERLNVQNGLCLSRLHDAAFDRWLITFDDDLRLVLSRRIKAELPQKAVAENFAAYEGQRLHLPDDALVPMPAFLAAHREIFHRMD